MQSADWQSTRFRQALVHMVKKRVPERDVEDVVQATLTDAVTAKEKPEDPDALRRWIWGIARHKVADFHRRSRREELEDRDLGITSQSEETNDMLRWAMKNLPDGSEETLQWLLREAEGEKLESIAQSANVPAARVRKRVSRLRAHLREHWRREVIALAALGVTLGALAWLWRRTDTPGPIAVPEVPIVPDEVPELKRARALRERALEQVCPHPEQSSECIKLLDQAKELDPVGDTAPAIGSARTRAMPMVPPKAYAKPVPKASSQSLTPSIPPATKMSTPQQTTKPAAPSKPAGGSDFIPKQGSKGSL